jgi:hypothetical protein
MLPSAAIMVWISSLVVRRVPVAVLAWARAAARWACTSAIQPATSYGSAPFRSNVRAPAGRGRPAPRAATRPPLRPGPLLGGSVSCPRLRTLTRLCLGVPGEVRRALHGPAGVVAGAGLGGAQAWRYVHLDTVNRQRLTDNT